MNFSLDQINADRIVAARMPLPVRTRWEMALDEIERLQEKAKWLNETRGFLADSIKEIDRLRARNALLEKVAITMRQWVKWWNGPGRIGYRDPIIPPLTQTAKELHDLDALGEGKCLHPIIIIDSCGDCGEFLGPQG